MHASFAGSEPDTADGRLPRGSPTPSVTTRAFTALEDAIAHAERADGPMVMGFTLVLDAQLDVAALSTALGVIRTQFPMLAARRESLRRWQRWPRWSFDAPMPVVAVFGADQLSGPDPLWGRWLAEPFPLERGPLVRVGLARGAAADTLLVAVHHAAVDGVGALILLQSLASAYRGVVSLGTDDEVTVRGTVAAAVPGEGRERGIEHRRGGAVVPPGRGGVLAVVRAPRAARIRAAHPHKRVATTGATEALPGHGVTHRWLDAGLTGELVAQARVMGVTVTDVLAGALHLAIAEWNGRENGLVTVTVPVRPPLGARGATDRGADPTTNRTLQVTTCTAAHHRLDPARCVVTVSGQVGLARIDGAAGAEPAAAGMLRFLPERWRRRVPAIGSRLTGDRFLASSRLSNLGAVPAGSLCFGPVNTRHMGFSTPVRMPQGITLGVVGYDGRLDLAFRWCRPAFAAADAEGFADIFEGALRRVCH